MNSRVLGRMSFKSVAEMTSVLNEKDRCTYQQVSKALDAELPLHGPNGALFRDLPDVPNIEYLAPGAVLSYFSFRAPPFWDSLVAIHIKPLGLLWYSDVATGGNVLEPRKAREAELVWWSFREFGEELLCREDSIRKVKRPPCFVSFICPQLFLIFFRI